MKNRYRLLAIFLSIFILNLIFPIRVYCDKIGNKILTVDNFVPAKEEWQRIGADYQIDSNDNDTSYAWFNYTNEQSVKELSRFYFENIGKADLNVTSILNVTMYSWVRADTPGTDFRVRFYWWNGTQTVLSGSFSTSVGTWFIFSHDLSSVLDTPEKVENVRLYLTNTGAPSYDDPGRISYVWLDVTFTYIGIYIYPLRLILGLVGLAIMIISPTIGVKEVIKKKNWEMVGGCIALFVIGYALVICWLVP